jgi:methylmalonyl-CoA/ethylmalonyl-CoA epimerase
MKQITNKVDHVIFCVEPENIHDAASTFAKLLDIDLEGPFDMPAAGLTLYVDWTAGIEIMTPVDPAKATEQRSFLDRHGEGVFRICFNFPDRDKALERAEAMGFPVRARFDFVQMFPQWRNRFSSSLESQIDSVHGVNFNFCQIERTDGS